MTTHLQFNYPLTEAPVWASNANRTTDPDSTLGDTVPIVKEDGWEFNQRPPAKVMNWLQHYMLEYQKHHSAITPSNWLKSTAPTTNLITAIVYSPPTASQPLGRWTCIDSTGYVRRSQSGDQWANSTALSSAPVAGAYQAACVSTNYTAIFGVTAGLEYNSSGTSTFTAVSNATIGGSFAGGAIAMDANGNRTIVLDRGPGAAVVRIAATGVNGSWISPTTPPSLGTGTRLRGRVLYAGGSKWFAYSRDSTDYLSVSLDDGDVWSSKTLPAYSSSNTYAIAYDPSTARLVALGAPSGGVVAALQYSDDDGATWTDATCPMHNFAGNGDVYSCGGGVWVAVGGHSSDSVQTSIMSYSVDNAETWHTAEMHDAQGATGGTTIIALMSDGRKVVSVGAAGYVARTLGYPDFR